MARFHIVIIRPSGYIHSDCFQEVAETVRYGLKALGHEAEIRENYFSRNAWNIVFGSHLCKGISLFDDGDLITRPIVYNLEQHEAQGFRDSMRFGTLGTWWDYSAENLVRYPAPFPARLVPIGYMPEMTRIRPREQDLDVVFFGSMNERRALVLNKLANLGYRTVHQFGVYGRERDELISRAKVCLNVHFYESKIFEIVRCSYLMANYKAVVSEDSIEIDPDIREGIAEAPYGALVEAVRYFLENEKARKDLQDRGFEAMKKRDEEKILEAALEGVDLEIPEEATTNA